MASGEIGATGGSSTPAAARARAPAPIGLGAYRGSPARRPAERTSAESAAGAPSGRRRRAPAAGGGGAPARTVSWGSSARAVPTPTPMASMPARRRCTARRERAPVSQPCRRAWSASAPSRERASLRMTHGRSEVKRKWNGAFSSRAAVSSTPARVATPRAARKASAAPASGSGSRQAATTRATPARRTASVQGGVLP